MQVDSYWGLGPLQSGPSQPSALATALLLCFTHLHHLGSLLFTQTSHLAGSGNLEAIHIIKKPGGALRESFLDEGYILDKKIGVGQV